MHSPKARPSQVDPQARSTELRAPRPGSGAAQTGDATGSCASLFLAATRRPGRSVGAFFTLGLGVALAVHPQAGRAAQMPTSATAATPAVDSASAMVNPKDGMVLMRIPGGTYRLGADQGKPAERPVHQVTLRPYALGRTEVTNAQYRRFVEATRHRGDGDWADSVARWGEQAPVVRVSWYDAQAYCAWAGLRLPTEAEWEVAARGPQGRTYPWGDLWDASRCRNSVGTPCSPESPGAVASYPQGASPFGCLDMAGNVWEWCSSKYKVYPYEAADGREALTGYADLRVIRGGAWNAKDPTSFRGAHRYAALPSDALNILGFRAAKSL